MFSIHALVSEMLVVLATRMNKKISQELFNISFSPPVLIGDSMGPDSWRFSQYPIQKTGSGAWDPLTQLTCLPDLAPIVTRSTPDSGCMAVSYLRKDQHGPQHSSSLWHPYQIRQHHRHNSSQPIPGSDHQPSGTQPELLRVVKALTFIHKACRAWRANPLLAVTWNTVKPSISSSVIRCFAKATETIIDTNKMKHLVVQFLQRLRPQFPISYWSPTHLQEIHIGKIHHKRCTPWTMTWQGSPPGTLKHTHTVQVLHTRSLQNDHKHEEIVPWLHQAKQETILYSQGRCPW